MTTFFKLEKVLRDPAGCILLLLVVLYLFYSLHKFRHRLKFFRILILSLKGSIKLS